MKSNLSPVMSIVWTELRRRRMYLLWWSIGIILLVGITVLAYGSVRDQAAELNKAFGNLSSSIGSFVGSSDMFSPVGYMNSQLYYITLPILFILLSVTLASSLLNKEEGHHTLELLLSRPISRTQVLVAKALTAGAVLAILSAVTALTIIACSQAVHIDIPVGNLLLATVGMALFSGAFGAIAFMLFAASTITRRVALPVAILVSFGGYILSSLGGMVDSLAWAAKLFPYHYYDSSAMLGGHIPRGLVTYLGIIYIVALVIAIAGFRRRDIE
jgi:ABC-2 type transport system permease protein